MQPQDYPSFNHAIENAIQDLYRDARYFCYHDEPEFRSLIEKMRRNQELIAKWQKEWQEKMG